MKSQWDAIYSDPQAARGQALYAENCAICHAGTLAGPTPRPRWLAPGSSASGTTSRSDELFEFMQTAMPVQSPGGLSRQQNADILAHILRAGKFPSGQTELTPDRNLLRQTYLLASKPGSGTPPPAATPADAPPKPAARVVGPVEGAGNGGGRFYTDVQAERGRLLFNRNCGFCHSVDPKIRNVRNRARWGRTTRSAERISTSE